MLKINLKNFLQIIVILLLKNNLIFWNWNQSTFVIALKTNYFDYMGYKKTIITTTIKPPTPTLMLHQSSPGLLFVSNKKSNYNNYSNKYSYPSQQFVNKYIEHYFNVKSENNFNNKKDYSYNSKDSYDDEDTQNKTTTSHFAKIYQYNQHRKHFKIPVLKVNNFYYKNYPVNGVLQTDGSNEVKIPQYDIREPGSDIKSEDDEYSEQKDEMDFNIAGVNDEYMVSKKNYIKHKDNSVLEDSKEYDDIVYIENNDNKSSILIQNSAENDYFIQGVTLKDIEFFKNYYGGHSEQLRTNAVFPGTIWCGPGNKAPSDNTFGLFFRTDLCCRDHDRCFDTIPPRTRKYGLYNDGMFTKSHCDCDLDFYICLKKVNSFVSYKVGYAYFNIYKPKCFRKEYPVIRCVEWFNNRCQLYLLDETREEHYQWFDNRHF